MTGTQPALTSAQRAFLRARAHALQPVVYVGAAGVSAAVAAAVDGALRDHELIKVKLRVGDREARAAGIDAICSATGATVAGRVGNVAILYRRNPQRSRIVLPRPKA
ncbi:MAG: YhbY family RNA-binding protein [Gammaproteobacteria bacterium]